MIGTAAVVGSVGTAGGVLAAAADSFDPVSLIGTAVTPVVVVLLLVTGWLRTRSEAERLEKALQDAQDDADEARAQHAALVTKLVNDIVPALTRSADATAASTAAVQELTRRALAGGG